MRCSPVHPGLSHRSACVGVWVCVHVFISHMISFSGFCPANYTERTTCCRSDSFYAHRPPVVRGTARTLRACVLCCPRPVRHCGVRDSHMCASEHESLRSPRSLAHDSLPLRADQAGEQPAAAAAARAAACAGAAAPAAAAATHCK